MRSLRSLAVASGLALGLGGCQLAVLDPAGAVAKGDSTILIDSLSIMLAIVVPTIAATFAFAWWFRASNAKARYLPDFEFSGQLEMITWSIPTLTIMLLGGVIWLGSHKLDPAAPLADKGKPLEVQVVSLDWKWLFIYPDQHIASVNKLTIPAGAPVHFTLTSASVMNALFIPRLGSMIYTMNRMGTELNLIADQPGNYAGLSSQFSGDGFSDMFFEVEATPQQQFTAWADQTRNGGGDALTAETYETLAKPTQTLAPYVYHDVQPGLFEKIVSGALPPGPGPSSAVNVGADPTAENARVR